METGGKIVRLRWNEETDVVVVGYGGAGAATAITAHDAGARVLILEKQAADTPLKTCHTPSTRMSAGGWFAPRDEEKACRYLESLARIANEAIDGERQEIIRLFARYSVQVTSWLKQMGVRVGNASSLPAGAKVFLKPGEEMGEEGVQQADFDNVAGSEGSRFCVPLQEGNYRGGAGLFKALSDAVRDRSIPVIWSTPAAQLVTVRGRIRGVVARQGGKTVVIKANRGVVLTCGGFAFNEWMKENYLRVHPTHFYGNPGNTGEGIVMAQRIGADLWHMNCSSFRVTMKFADIPVAFGTQRHETASIFVDRRGRRFTSELLKLHASGYELTNYDSHAMCYPKVPCFWVFDEKRRSLTSLGSTNGAGNPPGGIPGDIHYIWSEDNQQEIDRGWVIRANTLDELARRIASDPDNGGMMTPAVLEATVRQYNNFCRQGEDLDFHKPKEFLQPIEDPPYYAVKLWPGGPNTQGGPRRNARAQVMSVDNDPIPRLYSAGELGSIWGMLYQGGGNITECIAFGRIAGINVAAEQLWK